jgi:hypothetical protein
MQINLNKSKKAHLDILNAPQLKNWDLILIQEPHLTFFRNICTPNCFTSIHPTSHHMLNQRVCFIIWVNPSLSANFWKALEFADSNDVTAIQLSGEYGYLSIFNIYNNCEHSQTLHRLREYVTTHAESLWDAPNHFMLWAGDFN